MGSPLPYSGPPEGLGKRLSRLASLYDRQADARSSTSKTAATRMQPGSSLFCTMVVANSALQLPDQGSNGLQRVQVGAISALPHLDGELDLLDRLRLGALALCVFSHQARRHFKYPLWLPSPGLVVVQNVAEPLGELGYAHKCPSFLSLHGTPPRRP